MGRVTLAILKHAALGAGLVIAASTPRGAKAITELIVSEASKQYRYYLKKRLKKLEAEGLILWLGGDKITLTEQGKSLYQQLLHDEIAIKRSTKWDGVWRLIAYDIPNNKRNERDAFRRRLTQWGFSKIQESLWAFPYECREEVAVVAQDLAIAPYVIYMTATRLPQEQKLKMRYSIA